MVSFISFLAPGLISMQVIQQSFSHSSSSFMIGKIQGNIVDILYAPLSAAEVTFTVSDYSGSGTVKPMLGVVGAVSGATVNADGTYTQILVADANQSVIAFRAGGTAFNGKIDNVSIKEYAIQPLDI